MRKLLFLFLFYNFCFSQNYNEKNIDAVVSEMHKMKNSIKKVTVLDSVFSYYRDQKIDQAVLYAKIGLETATKIEYSNGRAIHLNNLSNAYTDKGDYKKAEAFATEALKHVTQQNTKGFIYMTLSNIYFKRNELDKALEYNTKSLSIFEKLDERKWQSFMLKNRFNIYIALGDFEKAKEYNQKSKEVLLENYNPKLSQDKTKSIEKNQHGKLKEIDENYYDKKIKEAELKNNIAEKSEFLTMKVINLVENKKYDLAIEVSNEALATENKIGNSLQLPKLYENLCDAYYNKYLVEKNTDLKKTYLNKALENGLQCLELINKSEKYFISQRLYKELFEIYKQKGDYNNAILMQEKYYSVKIDFEKKERFVAIKKLENKREIELRDKEIALQQQQKYLYILGIGFLATLGGLLIYQNQKRKKNNQKLQILNTELDQANKIKTRFFGILNHDLRAPVANLIGFLNLQKNSPELLDETTKLQMESKTITGAENLLTSMEDILLWSKGQMESFKPQLKTISADQLFDDTKKVFSGYQQISFFYENHQNLVFFTDENYLKTIIRNLTSNAINAFATTQNPTIIWKAYSENDTNYLSVSDNGLGGTSEQFKALYDDNETIGIKSGLGLHLIRDLAKAINCKIEVDSKIGIGTTFTLLIA